MEFLYLGNIPQSLQGVNARETCTSFWTRRRRNATRAPLTPPERYDILKKFREVLRDAPRINDDGE